LGTTGDKMGVLSRRVPLERKPIKHLARSSLNGMQRVKMLVGYSSTIMHKKTDENKRSLDLRVMDNSKIEHHKSIPETIQVADKEMIKIKCNSSRKQTAGTMTEHRSDMSWNLSVHLLGKKRSAMTIYSIAPDKATQENDEHLVHSYSFPNTLSMQKKQRVMTEAERIYFDKYSNSIGTQQLLQPHLTGFKGKKLSQSTLSKGRLCESGSKKKVNVPKHRRSVAAQDSLLKIGNIVSKKGESSTNVIKVKTGIKKPKTKIKENEAERDLMRRVDQMSTITDVSTYNLS
jgi:hypothetical protein